MVLSETNTVYQKISNSEILNQLKRQFNSETIKIKLNLSFLEASKPSGDNYLNVKLKSPEWQKISKLKCTGSSLPTCLEFNGKPKLKKKLGSSKNRISRKKYEFYKKYQKNTLFWKWINILFGDAFKV